MKRWRVGVDPKIFIDNVISELKDMALKSDKRQEINWSLDEIARCISTMEDISLKLRWYSFPRLVLVGWTGKAYK